MRRIAPAAREEVLGFLESNFCVRMQERGDLIGARVEEDQDGLRLVHPLVEVPAFPWEWTASAWVEAAELTLRLCEEGLAEGWILKDATPLNILYVGSRPVLVDFLSFVRRDPASSIWLAYGQFVRTFLLPLLMHQKLGWPLRLSLFKRDGFEPAEMYQALGWMQRLSRGAFWPITLPALLERKSGAGPAKTTGGVRDPGAVTHVLRGMLRGLGARVRRALPAHARSQWSDYAATLTHYTGEQSDRKRAWVRGVLGASWPAWVLDVGANTGEYSRLAAESGAKVVALERDEAAADRLFRLCRDQKLGIQTICADLARPTPAVGWENAESAGLLDRLTERFDLVMMLAVIHHLVLMEQIPLAAILGLCARLTRRQLIVEWVPVTDPMYQSLMRGRETLYGGLDEQALLTAAAGLFRLMDRELLGNGRVLFLFEKM